MSYKSQKQSAKESALYQEVINNICKLEADFNKSQFRAFKDKVEAYDEKLLRIQKGTSAEYLKELKKLTKQREYAFQAADLNNKYKVSLIEKIHMHEVQLAESEFEAECQAIRANLLVEIEEKIHKLKDERENVDVRNGYEVEMSTRNHPTTRRNRKRGELEGSGNGLQKGKKRQSHGPASVAPLKEDQINKDLSEMRRRRDA